MTDKPKRKAGRPKGSGAITWDEKQKEQAGKLAGIGCNLNQIANIMGVSPATLDVMIARDPSISKAISNGRDNAAGQVMRTAYSMAISGKIPAMTIFWLKTRQRWAEARDLAPEETDDNKNEFTLNYSPSKKDE
jgi:hypothetical protein